MVVYTQEAVKMKNNIWWVMNTRVYTHSVKSQKSKGHTLSDPYKSPGLPPGLIIISFWLILRQLILLPSDSSTKHGWVREVFELWEMPGDFTLTPLIESCACTFKWGKCHLLLTVVFYSLLYLYMIYIWSTLLAIILGIWCFLHLT